MKLKIKNYINDIFVFECYEYLKTNCWHILKTQLFTSEYWFNFQKLDKNIYYLSITEKTGTFIIDSMKIENLNDADNSAFLFTYNVSKNEKLNSLDEVKLYRITCLKIRELIKLYEIKN